MKKIILLIPVFLILVACSNEKANENIDITQEIKFSAKNFVNNTFAYKQNDVVKLGVTKDELLSSFNNYSTKFKLGSEAKSYLIEEISNKNYVRFFHEDGLVSTVALIPNAEISKKLPSIITYRSGSTVCTTTYCSNCCGCIPEGKYCTPCELIAEDCKRTTTGSGPVPIG
ncbi:hypothetical protein, partial [Winogradskyella sp.]|uniref:hypothetical protein n=1 Tax=Winogradskyella sp. TaxID=1883156 RepID=UPI0025CC74CC